MHGLRESVKHFGFGHSFSMHKETSSTTTHEIMFSVWWLK